MQPSRLIERMARAGYVARIPCGQDKHGQILAITAAAAGLRARMWSAYAAAIERRFGGMLSKLEVKKLAAILGKLTPSEPADAET